jgi:hypothetical protein
MIDARKSAFPVRCIGNESAQDGQRQRSAYDIVKSFQAISRPAFQQTMSNKKSEQITDETCAMSANGFDASDDIFIRFPGETEVQGIVSADGLGAACWMVRVW